MTFRRLVLAGLPLVLLLSACSATSSGPRVADLPSSSSTASAQSFSTPATSTSSAPSSTGSSRPRPQLRLDDSDARVAALVNTYRQCLLDHGAKRAYGGEPAAPSSGHTVGILLHQPIPPAAEAACVQVEPLEPRELRAATNPRFHQQSQAWIACMQSKGLWMTLVNDRDLTATYTPGHAQPDDVGPIEQGCRASVFGGGR